MLRSLLDVASCSSKPSPRRINPHPVVNPRPGVNPRRLAWATLWNLLDVVSYLVALALWASHLRCGSMPHSAAFSGALALQHVLLWTKLHYYARWVGELFVTCDQSTA